MTSENWVKWPVRFQKLSPPKLFCSLLLSMATNVNETCTFDSTKLTSSLPSYSNEIEIQGKDRKKKIKIKRKFMRSY